METPKKPNPRGRPRTRTDRWHALIALAYLIAVELAADPDEIRRHEEELLQGRGIRGKVRVIPPTAKGIVADATHKSEKTVGAAVTQAIKRDLFTRQLHQPSENRGLRIPTPRTRAGGRMTDKGWTSLGPVPQAWAEAIGPTWQVVTGSEARSAVRILATELTREEMSATQQRSR